MTNSKLKIALLCNNKMAIPAMQRLTNEGLLCGVAIPERDAETIMIMRGLAAQHGIACQLIDEKGHKQQLTQWLQLMQPDVVFVMTFPWKIGADMLAMPRLGFLNFHFGLLPEMRGADPIFECIRQRMPEAGATVHIMDDGLDTGPILLRESFPVGPDLTYGILSSQMALLGEKLCASVTTLLQSGMPLPTVPQDEAKAKYWPKITEGEITIDWSRMEKEEIVALVRAGNPVSKGAPTSVNGWKLAVLDVIDVNLQGDASAIAPGTIIAIDPQNGLIVCCKGGKAIKLEVVYTSEGYFPGYKLLFFGIQQGMLFGR